MVVKLKSIIGIVGRCGLSVFGKNNIEIFETYRNAVIKSGGIPIVILPPQTIEYYDIAPKNVNQLTEDEKDILNEQLKLCDGVIIHGGVKQFEYDKYICDYCNKNNVPLLGICMGMQVMCNYNNDNKNIKIEDDSHYSLDDYKHYVKIDKNSKLFEILDTDKIMVNSFHHFKVNNSGSYKIVAYDNDVIEAVEKSDYDFNIGLQWHPEKNYDTDLNSQKIFNKFIETAKKYKEKKIIK